MVWTGTGTRVGLELDQGWAGAGTIVGLVQVQGLYLDRYKGWTRAGTGVGLGWCRYRGFNWVKAFYRGVLCRAMVRP